MMRVVLVVVLVLCGVVPAQAQNAELGSLWRQVTSGDRVQVKEASGHQTSGIFGRVSESTVSVIVDGKALEIPASDVREVRRRGDSVKNGFLLGAGIGAGLAAANTLNCEGTPATPCMELTTAAIFGGLAGGGIGALVDHAVKGWTVAFRARGTSFALHPSVLPGPRGMHASLVVTVPFAD